MWENISLMSDENIENNVHIYKPFILECVIGTELLMHLPEINKDERNLLRAREREHGHRKVTEELLDLISQKTEKKGRWTSFTKALKYTDYKYVSMALERKDVKDMFKLKQIINILAKSIQEGINPKEMVQSLRKKKLISDQDGQEIKAEEDARGPIAASIVLLDRIPQRKQSWFKDFLDVMIEHNRTDLAMKMDDCYHGSRSVIYNRKRRAGSDDTDSDDNDGASAPKKHIKNLELRDYQIELARPGLNGQNCIVVAPTGSGKTHVALKIIQEHMKTVHGKRVPKVVFIVEQSALAEQQGNMCKRFLQYNVKTITGEVQRRENYKELSEWLQRRSILVVTAQLLVNALMSRDVEITQFSLLVFDECHHTNVKHPFNRIMHYYLDIKLGENTKHKALPQVIGLTASVGVGKADTQVAAVNWIEKIMAHLDAQEVATVRKQKQQLAEFVTVPEQTTVTVKKRNNHLFERSVNDLMAKIEAIMMKKKDARVTGLGETLQPPSGRGTGQYTQWLSVLWKETANCYDQDTRRHVITCKNYLELYNNALIIYFDARVKDALTYLEQEVGRINENAIQDETDKYLEKMYHESKYQLKSCLCEGNENPKLEKLKDLLIKTYTDEPDSRGIVIVKTRDLGRAIEAWMKETAKLRDLGPKTFFGAQASVERGGMTKNEQGEVLKYFRDGKHRVIIATSVAEEGLDIQKCNLVIRYDHVTNEIAMVQSRGRGRAEDSKYVLVAEKESKTVGKEELNLLRENMMEEAILNVQDRIESDRHAFLIRILKQQKEEKIIRDEELRNKEERKMEEEQFELRCHKCNNFVCMSSDVKTIMDAHHAVMSTDIRERISVKKASQPRFADHQIQSCVAKVICKTCGMDLGNVSIYKGAQFPIIKIMSFVIVDSYGNKNVVKKWKQAPFSVSPLSSSDIQQRIESSFKLLTY